MARSAFVRNAIESAVQQEIRWVQLEAAASAVAGEVHEWDADPGEWVRQQRRCDNRRAG